MLSFKGSMLQFYEEIELKVFAEVSDFEKNLKLWNKIHYPEGTYINSSIETAVQYHTVTILR